MTANELRKIMAEADENEDGLIEYREFSQVAVDVLQALSSKDAAQQAREREAQNRKDVEAFLLHGMPKAELEQLLGDVFRQTDVDGSGTLDRREFSRCIREAELGLTRKEINALMAEVDEDGDGNVSYGEFLPLCFRILVDVVSQDFANDSVPSDEKDLAQFFDDLFRNADSEDTGSLYFQVGCLALYLHESFPLTDFVLAHERVVDGATPFCLCVF